VHALGMTFYEATSFVEPYTEIAFPWDIAKAVVAGKRPEWPAERRVPPRSTPVGACEHPAALSVVQDA